MARSRKHERKSFWACLLLTLLAITILPVVSAGGLLDALKPAPAPPKATTTKPPAPAPTGSLAGTSTIRQRVLLLKTTSADTQAPELTLTAYGIPFDKVEIPQAGRADALPLEDATGNAQYSMVIIQPGLLQYDYAGVWKSAFTDAQWKALADFEIKHKVRRVTLDDSPQFDHGTEIANPAVFGCCNFGVTQPLSLRLGADFSARSGIVDGATVDTTGLFHYPSKITNANTTTAIAVFGPSSDGAFTGETVAGVVINHPDGREQMAFYMSFGWWSPTSNFLGHVYTTWGTRQMYSGFRRIYLSLQVDDTFLATEATPTFAYRLTPTDAQNVIAWQKDITARLPSGSSIRVLHAFNGNGVLQATMPALAIDMPETGPNYTYIKPLGTGTNLWPAKTTMYKLYNALTLSLDPLYRAIVMNTANRDEFFWCSHTYTHMGLDLATRKDVDNELSFNIYFADVSGLSKSKMYTKKAMVTPMITGLHNGDALASMVANGITTAVSDATRVDVSNTTYPYLPWISSTQTANYNGFNVIPRQATVIYFNCTTQEQNMVLYNNMYRDIQGDQDWNFLMRYETDRVTSLLLQLRHDGYMFHQANLRNSDLPTVTVPNSGKTGKLGLLQQWTENVVGRFTQLVKWPIVSPHMDDHHDSFLKRQQRDFCGHSLSVNKNATHYIGATVTSQLPCTVPVTVPGNVVRNCASCTYEKLGVDPLTVWVPLAGKGASVSMTFSPPVLIN
ncbi:hypothetical protein BC832DRAFT_591301 [Gaertneriomyces semiglobifer]|nr:hypothetical protein BC832DRAFT_591301 [Gaertneriomyces semiglobifer]